MTETGTKAGVDAGSGGDLSDIYRLRFTDDEMAFKEQMWHVLCREVFSHHIRADDTVIDLAAGSCEFINNIRCGRKIAVDLNPETHRYAIDAEVVLARSDEMTAISDASVDVVFTSNFFEHLPDKPTLLRTLAECRRVLRPGGQIIVLMPNMHYLGGKYWDYFDHHLPLTHRSLPEALMLAGYEVTKVVPRFLPYTVKDGRIPNSIALLRLYLRLPIAWRLLGRQMLVIARTPTP